ncbi:MerR family transcriptional regulator [Stappia taiwanensis]|uniref:MerR family transcriptional regulator n=1 Tax=Stappia taiwanensis TaxID=992267 RepID=A0A838XK29_9HYPH|nr:MerR family transcriptional regulator [Stappia taiwanensis]MBA4610227.1 MerR family transcriptional regulator [Stappia taiwanensis]
MEKSPDAFRTISEVADDLDLPQHVLRFWETRFTQIRPLKRGGGRRYYRPDDVDLLRGIRHLLYEEGYTIKGVQRILKEQGPRFVMQIWREDALTLTAIAAAARTEAGAEGAKLEAKPAPPAAKTRGKRKEPAAKPTESWPDEAPPPAASAERNAEPGEDEAVPRGILPEGVDVEPGTAGWSGLRLMERFLGDKAEVAGGGALSRDDVRRLQATLFELLECKRILDQAR